MAVNEISSAERVKQITDLDQRLRDGADWKSEPVEPIFDELARAISLAKAEGVAIEEKVLSNVLMRSVKYGHFAAFGAVLEYGVDDCRNPFGGDLKDTALYDAERYKRPVMAEKLKGLGAELHRFMHDR